jgi:hypothetical protein
MAVPIEVLQGFGDEIGEPFAETIEEALEEGIEGV